MTPTLIDPTGRPLPLDAKLGTGGEGDVFALASDVTRVVKVYHRPPTPQTVEKLTAMAGLATPGLLRVAAWPTGLVRDARTRLVAGFLMPRVTDCRPVQELYNPAQRLRSFPRAGWAFQVRAALNLAAAFDEVHTAGCLVGDVNQSNALVSQTALVRLIDCDSFQVNANAKQYLCDVGVPHYTPPELQGRPLRGLTRTANHDRFGLAVLIYQLLFVGRHPYAGVYSGPGDPSFEQLIAEYRFAQGPDARTWKMAPPPHTPTLADLPPALGTLLRRAFERAHTAHRPTPGEWHAELHRLEGAIATCQTDAGHTFWRGAGPCVWCRLAVAGPEYYFGVAGGVGTFAVDEERLQAALQRLEAARATDFAYDRNNFTPAVPPAGKALPVEFGQLKLTWQAAVESLGAAVQGRKAAEAAEKQLAANHENQVFAKLELRYLVLDSELESEYEFEREAADEERRGRQVVAGVLSTATLSGIFLIPLGLIHRGFLAFGILIVLVFGIWLAIYVVLFPFTALRHRDAKLREKRHRVRSRMDDLVRETKSQTETAIRAAEQTSLKVKLRYERIAREAEQTYQRRFDTERSVRHCAERDAECAIALLEREWSRLVTDSNQTRSVTHASILPLFTQCRSLTAECQRELARLTANAEAAGRMRHLGLHPIADAAIHKVGAGRKQTLASYGILTAADVNAAAVFAVPGFGESLTANVIAWRDEVLRGYRFDPATAVAPAEQRATVLKFRGKQQQFLNEIAGHLAAIEALAPAARAALQPLRHSLRQAVARYEQARADLRVLTGSP